MIRLTKILGAATLAAALVGAPSASFAGVFVGIGIGVNVNFAPPPLPVYEQPPCPQPNYLWTPGYWGYEDAGYYWVPGAWVEPPQIGFLWTPGYWGYGGGLYAWHPGYWGSHVGFYGGVSYGGGYFGSGFYGGGWFGNSFRYNTAYANVNRTVINNTYINRNVINNYNNTTSDRVSYNGGPGGLQSRPTFEEQGFRNEEHAPATLAQREQVSSAAQNREQFANINHGQPPQTANGEANAIRDRSVDTRPTDRYPTNYDRASRPSYASPISGENGGAVSGFNRTSQQTNAQSDRSFERPSYAQNTTSGERENGYRTSAAAPTPNRYRAGTSPYGSPNTYRPQNQFGGARNDAARYNAARNIDRSQGGFNHATPTRAASSGIQRRNDSGGERGQQGGGR